MRNRDANDPGSGARRRPRAPSGSFTSRFRASKLVRSQERGCGLESRLSRRRKIRVWGDQNASVITRKYVYRVAYMSRDMRGDGPGVMPPNRDRASARSFGRRGS
jgi:hypothetical protein